MSFTICFDAFMLGLTYAPLCLGFCVPILLPFMAARAEPTLAAGGKTLGIFLLGRLSGYLAFGLILGGLGQYIILSSARMAVELATLLLAIFLIYYAVKIQPRECNGAKDGLPARNKFSDKTRNRAPFWIGALCGISLCPAFLLAATVALKLKNPLSGMLFFLIFFLGTSCVLLPTALLPRLARRLNRQRLRNAGSAIGMIIGFTLALQAIASLSGTAMAVETEFISTEIPSVATNAQAQATWQPPAVLKNLPAPTLTDLLQVAPGMISFVLTNDPGTYYQAFASDKQGNTVPDAYVFLCQNFMTAQELNQSVGYFGQVPVLLGIDPKGVITGFRILSNRESPVYLKLVKNPKAFASYAGKNLQDLISKSEEIDIVSGATFTSGAIEAAIRLGGRGFAEAVLGNIPLGESLPEQEAATWQRISNWKNTLFIITLVIGTILLLQLRYAWIEIAVQGVSFIVLGIILQKFFSLNDVMRLALRELPPWPEQAGWYLSIGAILLLTIFCGRVFCLAFCPFGALTELLWQIFRVKLQVPYKLDRALRLLPAIILSVVAILTVFTVAAPQPSPAEGLMLNKLVDQIEPFAPTFLLFSGRLAWGSFISSEIILGGIILLALLGGVFFRRFWCFYLCPAGAALRILSRLRICGRVRSGECLGCSRKPDEDLICEGCARRR
ncbi:MAG: sulfite exporter TauE/SafE family protein [Planctomycetes bacterium]|nr:sulfite exporter TauE/SafE family protein [Planctomycetota bacterium]